MNPFQVISVVVMLFVMTLIFAFRGHTVEINNTSWTSNPTIERQIK